MAEIEADYLVVGAGASGMAFTDTLIEQSDADVVLVDRRDRPGGHWLDAYPFVRLHQPARWYGVPSRELAAVDFHGIQASEAIAADRSALATGAEVCAYYERVLDDHLLPSGQVRFLGLTDYQGGEHGCYEVVSRVTGERTTVRVRRRLVDATYPEASIPRRHTPSFTTDPDVCLIPPNDLVDLDVPASGYTVLGGGKTAMDTCFWLLEQGVAHDQIRWIRPQDSWYIDRDGFWPEDGDEPVDFPLMMLGMQTRMLEAAAEATDVHDFPFRYEAHGIFQRLDTNVMPAVFRGATISRSELDALRRIDDVVRFGRVTHLGRTQITLVGGELATEPGRVHVDCTASGVGPKELAPIFGPAGIRLNLTAFGNVPLSGAMTAWVEANRDDDAERNRLCPSLLFTGRAGDFAEFQLKLEHVQAARMSAPDLMEWMDGVRLNLAAGVMGRMSEPAVQAALGRLMDASEAGVANLERIVAAA